MSNSISNWISLGDEACGGVVFQINDNDGTGAVCSIDHQGTKFFWADGEKFCHDLNENGYSDWRLASEPELRGIYEHLQRTGKHNFVGEFFWGQAHDPANGWFIRFHNGEVGAYTKTGHYPGKILPVRTFKISKRKDQANLTTQEWTEFKKAIKDLKAAPSSATAPNYQQIVQCHEQAMSAVGSSWGAHGSLNFLTWHRAYLKFFERRLQDFNPNVTLPYWDWSKDRAIPSELNDPSEWGVSRNPSIDLSGIANPQQIATLLNTGSFSSFSSTLESGSGMHGSVHVLIGGEMGGASSPADPIFWLHHCYIDKLFADWVQKHPTAAPNAPTTELQPAPFVTGTNEEMWKTLNLEYVYL